MLYEVITEVRPITWPVGQGKLFKGVYNLLENQLYLFRPGEEMLPTDVVGRNNFV